MRNTNVEFNEALALLERAKELQAEATAAMIECTNYLEAHTEKPLYLYGTDLWYSMLLLQAIENYVSGDTYVEENMDILVQDIKDAMDVQDSE